MFHRAAALGILLSTCVAMATIFGSVQGIVHDPQHRPVQNATVTLKAASLPRYFVKGVSVPARKIPLSAICR